MKLGLHPPDLTWPKGKRVPETIDGLRQLAEHGFQVGHGRVADVWRITSLEIIGREVPSGSGGSLRLMRGLSGG